MATRDYQSNRKGFQLDCGRTFLQKQRLQELRTGRSLFIPALASGWEGRWSRGLGKELTL